MRARALSNGLMLPAAGIALLLIVLAASSAVDRRPNDAPHWNASAVGDTSDSGASGDLPAECRMLVDHEIGKSSFVHYFDPAQRLSYLFVHGGEFNDFTLRFQIDRELNWTATPLPMPNGFPSLAVDLDLDGRIELAVMRADFSALYLDIRSAPDWRWRARLVFPGMTGASPPTAVNVDADPYPELYFMPSNAFGGASLAVLVDYDSVRDTFVVIASIVAPYRTGGDAAAADFDGDGRMEFISGSGLGYVLFECDGQALTYVGYVIGPISPDTAGQYLSAIACKPKPDGVYYALLGSVDHYAVYRAWLVRATGDNRFEIVRTWQHQPRGVARHDVYAADIDCDGLDELIFVQDSTRVWDWDETIGDFVPGCQWTPTENFQATDLDQNGRKEWSHLLEGSNLWSNRFRAFEDPRCPLCCPCHGDPLCDSVKTDVRDVVTCIAVVIRGASPTFDPPCPRERTDVDCSGITDILDIVHAIAVAFQGASPPTEFCPRPLCNAAAGPSSQQ